MVKIEDNNKENVLLMDILLNKQKIKIREKKKKWKTNQVQNPIELIIVFHHDLND
jgi:hypothetical protein